MGTSQGDNIAREYRSIVFYDHERLIAMLFMDCNAFKAVSVLLEDKTIDSFANDRVEWQHNLIDPFGDWNTELQALSDAVLPSDVTLSGDISRIIEQLIVERRKELKRPRCRIDFVIDPTQRQVFDPFKIRAGAHHR